MCGKDKDLVEKLTKEKVSTIILKMLKEKGIHEPVVTKVTNLI